MMSVKTAGENVGNKGKYIYAKIKKYLLITASALVYSAAVALFLDPNNIAPGGVTGIAILINRFTGIPTGTMNMLLNVPVILLGLWKFGWKFILSTAYAVSMITVFTNWLSIYGAWTEDLLIAGVLGGILMGVAMAAIFRCGTTTGGIDIVVKVLRLKWKHIKTNKLFLIFDMSVVLASWIVFHDMTVAFYAGIACFAASMVMDYMLYGPDEAKLIYIITDVPERIKERLLNDLDISATLIDARGAYTDESRQVIMTVMRKQVSPKVEEIVKEEDSAAFMIVTSASEIFGEGYKDLKKDRI